ncbi:hypothetical protein L484_010533 [Morus notabilis]|uniref:Uncharacterized protein n=1 Tax=Morus notabilis TaxID=981085 RepID=W9RHD7_9ROSA|nr:glutaredoxin-C9 [Morus notabilis]EXB54954.1 hypothetical protein L484_010533 [Morus notabilis]
MQQAIPYKSWLPLHAAPTSLALNGADVRLQAGAGGNDRVTSLVTENAVTVFARRGCCMGHVVKHLLLGHGANPAVCELDEADEIAVAGELEAAIYAGDREGKASPGSRPTVQFPAVFIGGRLFGGLDRVMAAHISGELVPLLKQAGALWL